MHRITPFRSPLFAKKKADPSHPGISKSSIERLSQPRAKDPRWLPDKPSVYWLDYLIDPTPHKITDVDELQGYYDRYESKYPRTHSLATPRKYYGTLLNRDVDWEPKISMASGIPLSALKYTPTRRIRELATPKPEPSYSDLPWLKIPGITPKTSRGAAKPKLKRSFLTGTGGTHSHTAPPHVQNPRSTDSLAKGDFKSRSTHGLQNPRERTTSKEKARSLSRTNRSHPQGRDGGSGGEGDGSGSRQATEFPKRSSSLGRK